MLINEAIAQKENLNLQSNNIFLHDLFHRQNKKRIWGVLLRKSKKIIINGIIRVLQFFVKKDYSLWLFSMEGGRRFSGNALYFLEYITKHAPEIRTVCFANVPYVKDRIEVLGSKACKPNSMESLYYALKAGVCVFSHEMASDLNNFSKRNTLKINLWHGVPMKKFQYGSEKIKWRMKHKSIMQKMSDIVTGYVEHEEYDFIAYTTDHLTQIMSEAFNNPNIFLTGDPRDDIFFRDIDRNRILVKYGLEEVADKKIVTYLPTFRDARRSDEGYAIFVENAESRKRLADLNVVVFQKYHEALTDRLLKEENIYILPDEFETQELLYISDMIITDYSSVYFDFLHTLRPVIFYPYDLEAYIREDRELYYDYFDELATPGLKALNEEEVCLCIERYLAQPSLDMEKRKKSLAYFHTYSDGRSSERVYQAIKQLLAERNLA